MSVFVSTLTGQSKLVAVPPKATLRTLREEICKSLFASHSSPTSSSSAFPPEIGLLFQGRLLPSDAMSLSRPLSSFCIEDYSSITAFPQKGPQLSEEESEVLAASRRGETDVVVAKLRDLQEKRRPSPCSLSGVEMGSSEGEEASGKLICGSILQGRKKDAGGASEVAVTNFQSTIFAFGRTQHHSSHKGSIEGVANKAMHAPAMGLRVCGEEEETGEPRNRILSLSSASGLSLSCLSAVLPSGPSISSVSSSASSSLSTLCSSIASSASTLLLTGRDGAKSTTKTTADQAAVRGGDKSGGGPVNNAAAGGAAAIETAEKNTAALLPHPQLGEVAEAIMVIRADVEMEEEDEEEVEEGVSFAGDEEEEAGNNKDCLGQMWGSRRIPVHKNGSSSSSSSNKNSSDNSASLPSPFGQVPVAGGNPIPPSSSSNNNKLALPVQGLTPSSSSSSLSTIASSSSVLAPKVPWFPGPAHLSVPCLAGWAVNAALKLNKMETAKRILDEFRPLVYTAGPDHNQNGPFSGILTTAPREMLAQALEEGMPVKESDVYEAAYSPQVLSMLLLAIPRTRRWTVVRGLAGQPEFMQWNETHAGQTFEEYCRSSLSRLGWERERVLWAAIQPRETKSPFARLTAPLLRRIIQKACPVCSDRMQEAAAAAALLALSPVFTPASQAFSLCEAMESTAASSCASEAGGDFCSYYYGSAVSSMEEDDRRVPLAKKDVRKVASSGVQVEIPSHAFAHPLLGSSTSLMPCSTTATTCAGPGSSPLPLVSAAAVVASPIASAFPPASASAPLPSPSLFPILPLSSPRYGDGPVSSAAAAAASSSAGGSSLHSPASFYGAGFGAGPGVSRSRGDSGSGMKGKCPAFFGWGELAPIPATLPSSTSPADVADCHRFSNTTPTCRFQPTSGSTPRKLEEKPFITCCVPQLPSPNSHLRRDSSGSSTSSYGSCKTSDFKPGIVNLGLPDDPERSRLLTDIRKMLVQLLESKKVEFAGLSPSHSPRPPVGEQLSLWADEEEEEEEVLIDANSSPLVVDAAHLPRCSSSSSTTIASPVLGFPRPTSSSHHVKGASLGLSSSSPEGDSNSEVFSLVSTHQRCPTPLPSRASPEMAFLEVGTL